MAFNPAQQPLWPFITDIPIAGRPIPGGLSLGMTADPAYTNPFALRYRYGELYTTPVACDGNILEQLITDITGLTPGATYTFIVQFAVDGGQWYETESTITLEIPDDEVGFTISTDEHFRLATINEPENSVVIDFNTAKALFTGQLVVYLGDKFFAEDLTSDEDAITLGLGWRSLNQPNKIELFVEGNHDSQGLLYQDTISQNFLLNPVDQDANGKFWKAEVGPCLFIGIEPYTTSGFADFADPPSGDVTDPVQWGISVAEKALLAAIVNTQCPWVFIFEHQLIGGAGAYGVGGGTEILNTGTYQLTLHDLLKTYPALNRRIKRIFIARGHDHLFEHHVIDNIDYFQVASPSTLFSARRTEASGYLSGTDPVGLYCNDDIKGLMRASFNWHNGRIEFVDLNGNVVYEFGYGDSTDPTIEITTTASTRNTSIVNVRGGASDA